MRGQDYKTNGWKENEVVRERYTDMLWSWIWSVNGWLFRVSATVHRFSPSSFVHRAFRCVYMLPN